MTLHTKMKMKNTSKQKTHGATVTKRETIKYLVHFIFV